MEHCSEILVSRHHRAAVQVNSEQLSLDPAPGVRERSLRSPGTCRVGLGVLDLQGGQECQVLTWALQMSLDASEELKMEWRQVAWL